MCVVCMPPMGNMCVQNSPQEHDHLLELDLHPSWLNVVVDWLAGWLLETYVFCNTLRDAH